MERLGKVLVVEDDAHMLEMLLDFLKSEEYPCLSYPSAKQAFKAIFDGEVDLNNIDVILTDISMPEMDGLEFLERIHKRDPLMPVILMTAFGSIESAIEATRKNAFDYILKPFKLNDIQSRLDKAIHFHNLKRENKSLRDQISENQKSHNIIGKSTKMRNVISMVERISKALATVLITGESGTGKEVVAQAIHKIGTRSKGPFVAINCTSIPENLLESELFGHVKGSFTGAISDKKGLFEEANGGTIFLDEIGDLDLSLQAKILRVLQEKKIRPVGCNKDRDVDVRVIAATHRDLKKLTSDGSFREDLYYRLSVLPVQLPPLRERREDIPLLANHFLKKYVVTNSSNVKGFTLEAMNKLISNAWRGNVRELENVIERTLVLCNNEWIDANDLYLEDILQADRLLHTLSSDWPTLVELEKRYTQMVLDKANQQKEKAAQILGVNRRTLYRKELEWGLQTPNAHQENFDA